MIELFFVQMVSSIHTVNKHARWWTRGVTDDDDGSQSSKRSSDDYMVIIVDVCWRTGDQHS